VKQKDKREARNGEVCDAAGVFVFRTARSRSLFRLLRFVGIKNQIEKRK